MPYFYNFANTKNERLLLFGTLSFVFQGILESRTNSRDVNQKSIFQMTRKTVVILLVFVQNCFHIFTENAGFKADVTVRLCVIKQAYERPTT